MRGKLWAIALLVAACGGKLVPGSGSDAKGVTNVAALDTAELSKLLGRRQVECRFDADFAVTQYGGVDGFIAAIQKNFPARLARPGIALTQSEIDACVAALAQASCFDADPEVCRFKGRLPAKSGCQDDIECASGFCDGSYGDLDEMGICGVCTDYGQLGEVCTDDSPFCGPDLGCMNGVCTPRVALGEACADAPCAVMTQCRGGVCVPLGKAGDPCAEDATAYCFPPLTCQLGVCTPPLPLKPVQLGDVCVAPNNEAVELVCVLGQCDDDTGRCVPLSPDEQGPSSCP